MPQRRRGLTRRVRRQAYRHLIRIFVHRAAYGIHSQTDHTAEDDVARRHRFRIRRDDARSRYVARLRASNRKCGRALRQRDGAGRHNDLRPTRSGDGAACAWHTGSVDSDELCGALCNSRAGNQRERARNKYKIAHDFPPSPGRSSDNPSGSASR
jgi:hypothetical protein